MLTQFLPILKNVRSSWKTTSVGLLLILFSLYLIYTSNSAVNEIVVNGGMLVTGIALLLVQDPEPKPKKHGEV
jgi:hypothetical protein